MTNLRYYLLILQLEEYKVGRFLRWYFKNFGKAKTVAKKKLDWTPKAKFIYYTSILLFTLIGIIAVLNFRLIVAILFILIFYFLYFIFYIAALAILKPYELINRQITKKKIRNKVTRIENLKVVAITGSYGKTSTKTILYQLLSKKRARPSTLFGNGVYKTPNSFNTLFGIAKAIDYELNDSYDVFLCEMGAYKKGEIKELCEMAPPDISILTGINEQHLERFGSLNNTVEAKFEILENLKPGGIGIVNLDNDPIRKNLDLLPNEVAGFGPRLLRDESRYSKRDIKLYGYTIDGNECDQCIDTLRVGEWSIVSTGQGASTKFTLIHKNKSYSYETKLLGKGHLANILAATMAVILLETRPAGRNPGKLEEQSGIQSLIEKIKELEQIPHRLELKVERGINIIDDAYSSNPDGFKEALEVLSTFEGKKILITPGIVELGKRSDVIHRDLGRNASEICDEIVLVGESKMTSSLKEGIKREKYKGKLREFKSEKQVQEYIRTKVEPGSALLFENDLPDQYL